MKPRYWLQDYQPREPPNMPTRVMVIHEAGAAMRWQNKGGTAITSRP